LATEVELALAEVAAVDEYGHTGRNMVAKQKPNTALSSVKESPMGEQYHCKISEGETYEYAS